MRALAAAQRWRLARASAEDVRRFAADVGLRRPPRSRAAGGRASGAATRLPTGSLAHPRHWATFVLVGDGLPVDDIRRHLR